MVEDMWSVVCASFHYLYTLIIALFVLLFLNLFALYFGDPESISYMIAQLDMILLGVAFVITTFVYWKCLQREEIRTEKPGT